MRVQLLTGVIDINESTVVDRSTVINSCVVVSKSTAENRSMLS